MAPFQRVSDPAPETVSAHASNPPLRPPLNSPEAVPAELLHENRRMLATLLDNLPGMAYRCRNDVAWTMEFVSEGCRALTGYAPGELIANRTIDFAHLIVEEDRQTVWENVQSAVRERRPFELTYRLRRRDNALRWVWERGQGIFNAAGELQALEGFITDITYQKENELAVRQSEAHLAMVFGTARDMMLLAQVEPEHLFRVVSVNARYVDAVRATGIEVSAPDLVGKTFEELVQLFGLDAGTTATIRGQFEQVISTKQPLEFDEVTPTPHGTFYGATTIAPVLDEKGGCGFVMYSSQDMTARRHAEQALRESEEKFAKAFRASPDAISVHELESGRYIDVNAGFLRFFGFAREEIIGHTPLELGIWPSPPTREAFVEQLRREGSVHRLTVQVKLRDGGLRWCELASERFDIRGRPHNVTVLRDITEKLAAEQALKESEEKFAVAFRVSPDLVSISDYETGRYLEVNEAHEAFFGYSRKESLGRSPAELGIIASLAVRETLLQALEHDGHVRDFRIPARTREGRDVVISTSAEIFHLGGRKCVLRQSRDITAAVAAERALRESEEKFAKAFRSSPYSLTISELTTGRYVDVNEGFERASGYRREEVIGRTSKELGFWVNAAERDELVRRLRADGSVRGMEIEFLARGGRSVTALCSCELIELGGQQCILNTFEDITEKRRAEEQKALLEAQLRQSQKLEALGTLAGGIAHDFNNILTAIIVYRELAMMDADRPAELRRHLEEIGLAGNRAKELVRQILAFSRQQKHERAPLQLGAVVREALQLLRSSLPATIEIDSFIDPQAPTVLADATQVHQIIMNLGTNAAHAMRRGPGVMKVRLVAQTVDEEFCQAHSGLRPGSYARLSLADTGHGMDEAVRARIFEPFFTTKGPGEGTGLGLAVVHGIMQDHDGAIVVESTPGKGTTFDLFFPYHSLSTPAAITEEKTAPAGRGESVLVIEDESAVSEAVRAMLEKLGYSVTAWNNPVEALAHFRGGPARYDLVLTDHTMPHLTGLDVTREIHAVRADIPVVLMSGLSDGWTHESLRGFGIAELMGKPVDFAGLAQVVRRVLDRDTA